MSYRHKWDFGLRGRQTREKRGKKGVRAREVSVAWFTRWLWMCEVIKGKTRWNFRSTEGVVDGR